jgi:hypothetical protein
LKEEQIVMEEMPDTRSILSSKCWTAAITSERLNIPKYTNIILSEISKKEALKPVRMKHVETLFPIKK